MGNDEELAGAGAGAAMRLLCTRSERRQEDCVADLRQPGTPSRRCCSKEEAIIVASAAASFAVVTDDAVRCSRAIRILTR